MHDSGNAFQSMVADVFQRNKRRCEITPLQVTVVYPTIHAGFAYFHLTSLAPS